MKKLIVHLISESSGQTVKHTANTVLSKFSNIDVKKYSWPMTRNIEMLEEVMDKITSKPGIILHTLLDKKLLPILEQFCFDMKVPCVSVVNNIVNEISEYIGYSADLDFVYINKIDEQYFDKVDAIDYSLRHDDGKDLEDLEDSDIILIGPSRTSKTPTSVYLAYNGFKTANIPLIYNHPFPDFLHTIKNPLIVGLIINPTRLLEIRESRMNLLKIETSSDYTNIKTIQAECRTIKSLCSENNWLMIDVSMRSIEESAAIIMKFYYEHKKTIKKHIKC